MSDDWKKNGERNRRSEWNRQLDGNRRHSVSRKGGDTSRIFGFVVVAIIVIIFIGIVSNIGGKEYDVYDASYESSGYDSTPANEHTVPWDYKIQEMTVGDLIGIQDESRTSFLLLESVVRSAVINCMTHILSPVA